MDSAEIFTGCGGLALGLSRAGFRHKLMVEWNADAVATIEHNRKQKVAHVADWPIEKGDVREIDWNPHRGKISFLAGGPPCQPFAIGGKKAGLSTAN